MSNVIKVKRGAKANIPTLNAGELAFTTDTKEAYVGDGVMNHLLGPSALIGAATNLRAYNSSPYQITATADELIVKTGIGGSVRLLTSVSVSALIGVSGANGLRSGLSPTANTWYYMYVIYNPSTGTAAGFLDSASTPVLPDGYTMYALVSMAYYNSIPVLWNYHQMGKVVKYSEFSDHRVVNGGTSTTFTSTSLASHVPPNAVIALLQSYVQQGAAALGASQYSHDGTNVHAVIGYAWPSIDTMGAAEVALPTAQTFWYRVSGANVTTYIDVMGFTLQ
jgi:hypothetical protein